MRRTPYLIYTEVKSLRRCVVNDQSLSAALAPLEPLLSDPSVIEIMVDRPDRVLIERQGQLLESGVRFASSDDLRAAIDAALALGGVKFGPGQTIAEARLPDDSRV